jgi:hypothetical protein
MGHVFLKIVDHVAIQIEGAKARTGIVLLTLYF